MLIRGLNTVNNRMATEQADFRRLEAKFDMLLELQITQKTSTTAAQQPLLTEEPNLPNELSIAS